MNRPWHFHPTRLDGTFQVYRGARCEGRSLSHGKLAGMVNRLGPRSWECQLFQHVAGRPTLHGKGRTRHEAVRAAISSGGIP